MIFSKYNPDTGQETLGRSQRNRRLPRKKRIYGGDDDDIFKHAHQDDDFSKFNFYLLYISLFTVFLLKYCIIKGNPLYK